MTAFWRYWTASAISKLGSGVTALALPFVALVVLDASATEVGLVAGTSYVGWALLGLPAGPICAALPLRGLQVTSDLLRAAAIASVPIAAVLDVLTIGQVVLVALVTSCCDVLFSVGNNTFLPTIVPKQELRLRNSWISGMDSATTLAGPSLAGVLVQMVGAPLALIVDAVSYLGSALVLGTLPSTSEPRFKERPPMLASIREGWAFVTAHPIMRACLLDATAANFVGGALLTLVPLHLVRELDASPAVVGFVLASEGIGGLLGAVVAGKVSSRLGSAPTTIGATIIATAMLLLLPLASEGAWVVVFAVGFAGYAAGSVVASINTRTFRQVVSPPELLSRVVATVRFVSWGVVPVGSMLAGWLASEVGSRSTLLGFSLLAWVSPIVLLHSPIRGRRELDERMGQTASGSVVA